MTRTTSRILRFAHPFVLSGVDGVQPPGSYDVEIDEEPFSGLSFPVYRRIETRILLPWQTIGMKGHQTVCIAFADLEAALARDTAAEPRT